MGSAFRLYRVVYGDDERSARGKLRFHALPYDLEAFFGIDSIFGIQSILGAPVLVLPARGSNHPGKRSSPQAQKRA